jgi:hypothetical protein
MKRVALVLLLALARCGADPDPDPTPARQRGAIVNGSDDLLDGAVMALVVQNPDGTTYLCSGSAIGPHTLLTAAHCVVNFAATSRGAVIATQDALQGLRSGTFAHVDAARAHPDYAQRQSGDWNDIGLVHTREALSGPYLPLNRYPLERLILEGQPVREVGYGETRIDGGDSGLRRQVTKPDVRVVSAGELEEGPLVGLTCSGDSGGPALFVTPDGVTSVIGVASRGDLDCKQLGVSTRVDTYLPFIQGFMADEADAPSCGADGRCAPGCPSPDPDCPCAPDGRCTPDCPIPEADPDCPASCLFDGGSCIPTPTRPPPAAVPPGKKGGCGSGSGSALGALFALALLTRRRR